MIIIFPAVMGSLIEYTVCWTATAMGGSLITRRSEVLSGVNQKCPKTLNYLSTGKCPTIIFYEVGGTSNFHTVQGVCGPRKTIDYRYAIIWISSRKCKICF